MKIVEMTREHVELLMPFEGELFGPEAWSAASYLDMLRDPRHKHFVTALEDDDSLLGWAGVMVNGEDAEVLTVGTVPAMRRRGIGTELVRVLIDEAKRRGATQLFLEVRVDNDAAIALYEREGFASLGRRRGYYDNGRVDAITMRRSLT